MLLTGQNDATTTHQLSYGIFLFLVHMLSNLKRVISTHLLPTVYTTQAASAAAVILAQIELLDGHARVQQILPSTPRSFLYACPLLHFMQQDLRRT